MLQFTLLAISICFAQTNDANKNFSVRLNRMVEYANKNNYQVSMGEKADHIFAKKNYANFKSELAFEINHSHFMAFSVSCYSCKSEQIDPRDHVLCASEFTKLYTYVFGKRPPYSSVPYLLYSKKGKNSLILSEEENINATISPFHACERDKLKSHRLSIFRMM